jgi:hypothetical protein
MRKKRGYFFKKNLGQVWIETVIYTLIAFIMIGLVISFVKPKIEELQDKAIIEESVLILERINNLILEVKGVPGNQRIENLEIKKGNLEINGIEDKIIFTIESRLTYSEPGENINYGNVIVHTEKKGNFNIVTLTSDYNEIYNITYKNEDKLKTIQKGTMPYNLFILNKGFVNNKPVINFEIK